MKFQMEETANADANAETNANAKTNANADPSFLFSRGREAADKRVRDDSVGAFFCGLQSHTHFAALGA